MMRQNLGLDVSLRGGQYVSMSAVTASGYYFGIVFRVDGRLHYQYFQAALDIVIRGLDERIALSTVHRAIFEMQFRHFFQCIKERDRSGRVLMVSDSCYRAASTAAHDASGLSVGMMIVT